MRHMILELYLEYGRKILVIIEAPKVVRYRLIPWKTVPHGL